MRWNIRACVGLLQSRILPSSSDHCRRRTRSDQAVSSNSSRFRLGLDVCCCRAGRRLNSRHRLTIYPARSIRILICSPPGSSKASKPWLTARSSVIFFVTIFLAGRRPELIRRMTRGQ
jgi:hypothetical protein